MICQLRPGDDQAGVGAGLQLRHRAARAATPPRRWIPTMPEAHALPDRRPLPAHRPHAGRLRRARDLQRRRWPTPACPAPTSASRAACSTARATSCPTRMIEIWQADAEGRYAHPADGRPLASNSFRGFGRCADRQGRRLRLRHRQARPRARPRRHDCRRRTSMSASSRAACSSGCSRASTSPASRPTPTDPILALVPADRRDTLHRQARPGQARPLPLRHPPAGRQRDGVLRRVMGSDPPRLLRMQQYAPENVLPEGG